MSVTLPSELEQLLHEAGGSWPEADEDRLHELAKSWRDTSTKLDRLRGDGSAVAKAIATEHEGASIDAFHAYWQQLDTHLQMSVVATEQTAVAVDAMANATLSTKSAIVDILASGHAQIQQQPTVATAFIGPLIRAVLRMIGPAIGRLFKMLGQLIRSTIASLFNSIGRFFKKIWNWFTELFGRAPDPPEIPNVPQDPVYKRGEPLPPAQELIDNGEPWKGTGRSGGHAPLTADPNQVYYRSNPQTGEITTYSVYDENGYIIKRVDLTGRPHGGVPTPHVLEYKLNKNDETGEIRPGPINKKKEPREARPDEVP